MFNSGFENNLLVHDVISVLGDFVSLQPDLDETKVKAASKVAQEIDIERIIGEDSMLRAITPQTPEDEKLRKLVLNAWAYYTYGRLLLMYQGVLTDGGFVTEVDKEATGIAKSTANHHFSIAEAYMAKVITFLDKEKPTELIDQTKLTPRIRTFGGNEYRS